jgi:hypothetical protein
MLKREFLSFDGDEMYGREKNKNFVDNANRLAYDQADRKNPEVLDYMREKIERVASKLEYEDICLIIFFNKLFF